MKRTYSIAALLAAGTLVGAGVPAGAQTLVVGNKGENTVSFVDLSSGRERVRVPTGPMPHEVAISPDGRRAAVVAYGGITIDVFDEATARRVRTIDLSPNKRPRGLAWLRDGTLMPTAEGSGSIALVRPDAMATAWASRRSGLRRVVS